MGYDAIVIGAGTAGLFSAFRLSEEGKKVLLLERQPNPGGYATTFQRKGFVFESAVHCVDALGEGGEIREFLEDAGIAEKVSFIPLKNFARIIYPGHNFIADFNHHNFISLLQDNFPAEKRGIARLFSALERFYAQFDRFCALSLPEWLKLLATPFISPSFIKLSGSSAEQFIKNYIRDEKLIAIITDIWRFVGLPPSRLSAFYFFLVFRGYYYNPTAYVKGGVKKIFEAMVAKMKESGSTVEFSTTVVKINTDKGRSVKSVVTDKGKEYAAKVVISNANAIDTLTELIDDSAVKERYRRKLLPLGKSISAVQVYLGLSVPAQQLGMDSAIFSLNNTYNHREGFHSSLLGDYENCLLEMVDHAQIDPTLVPEGKGSLVIITLDSYSNWKDLGEEEYRRRKIYVADKLIQRAEKYLPGLSQYVEVKEVATPRTMQRYSLSPEGAIYGFASTVAQSALNRLPHKTHIRGLILAGAWTQPGPGVHGCFISGLQAAELALKQLT